MNLVNISDFHIDIIIAIILYIWLHQTQVNIFYQVGAFPHYTKDATVNGGIPQEGSLDRHLQQFRLQLHQKLPKGFDGT